MTANPRNANGARRRKLRARLKAEGRPCHICGGEIDYTLPSGHPLSFEVDEKVPVSRYWLGGYRDATECALDYANVDAAHRICNQRRGNRLDKAGEAPKESAGDACRSNSRDW